MSGRRRIPTPHARLLALAALAAILLAGGCATRTRTTVASPDLADALGPDAPIALVGITVAPALGATLAPADSADAEAALYRAFLAVRPDLVVWPVDVLAGQAYPATLAAVRTAHARGGHPAPGALAALASQVAGARFVALARLEADAVRSDAQRQDLQNPEARAEGLPEHASAWATTVSVEREVGVVLGLYDLQRGALAWEARADARDRQRYAYEAPLAGDSARSLQERLAAGDTPAHLSRRGESLRAPDLVDLLEQGVRSLVGRLPGDRAR